MGYPCAKFRLPRPFGFRVRADVRDIRQTNRQTDRRTDRRRTADHRLMPPPPPLRGGGITMRSHARQLSPRAPGEFNDTILEPLTVCSENFMTTVLTASRKFAKLKQAQLLPRQLALLSDTDRSLTVSVT